VYLNGSLIPAKRVKKEFDRSFTNPRFVYSYSEGELLLYSLSGNILIPAVAPSPQTPPGVLVRTPGTPGNGASYNVATPGIRLDNLPWFQFQEMLESHGTIYTLLLWLLLLEY
jgi:hypothetical protein